MTMIKSCLLNRRYITDLFSYSKKNNASRHLNIRDCKILQNKKEIKIKIIRENDNYWDNWEFHINIIDIPKK